MKHEHHTVMKILQDLAGYFVEHNIENLKINMVVNKDGAWIELEGKAATRPADLDILASALQVQRDPEIDDYHEHLLGMHMEDEDYNLVGMSIDSAYIDYYDEMLKIKVHRKNLYK